MRRAALLALVLSMSPARAWGQPAGDPGARPTAAGATTATTGVPLDAEAQRLRDEATRLERLEAEQEASFDSEQEIGSLWPTFLRTVVMLSAVCLLAYLLLGKLMPKILQIEPPAAHRRLLKVVDRLAIDQKRSIMILQLGSEYFLVGSAEQSISLMSKLDAEEVERLLAEAEVTGPKLARWSDLWGRRQAKGS